MEESWAAEKLLPGTEAEDTLYQPKKKPSRPQCSTLALTLLFSAFLKAIIVAFFLKYHDIEGMSLWDSQLYWSPILDDINLQYKTVLFNPTVFSSSVYREDASELVEKAWRDLGLEYTHRIDKKEADRIGFSPGQVKWEESSGGGFVTQLEVFHNLHCLDTLRQGLYYNFDYYHTSRNGIWDRSDAVVRKHMGHCLDQLRLVLQCTADTSLIGMTWVNTSSGEPAAFPQFRREHKCRDFNAIRAWASSNDHKGIIRWRPGDDLLERFP